MDHLAHPFDDAFFASLAAGLGIGRDDLPADYDPGSEWGNDDLDAPVPGMPPFCFMRGDDAWHGRMAVYLPGFDYRRLGPAVAELVLHRMLPETQMAALVGTACSRVVDAPCIGAWTVTDAQNNPDDADETVIMLAVPRRDGRPLPAGRGPS